MNKKEKEKRFAEMIVAGIWVNNKIICKENIKKEKPCYQLGYCPYGQLVESFPLRTRSNRFSCAVFGHDCPMYYHAEELDDFCKRRIEETKDGGKK
jgi:hypothetical protein